MSQYFNFLIKIFVISLFTTFYAQAAEQTLEIPSPDEDSPKPDFSLGARIYKERCALCHGNFGMGDGFIPLIVKRYPNTNLIEREHLVSLKDKDAVREMIVFGGTLDDVSELMPPWGNELTWTELESLVIFLGKMEEYPALTRKKLNQISKKDIPTLEAGRKIYQSRCLICHGRYGTGNGRLSKVIVNPPPYNLTESTLPEKKLREIILKGGERTGRSPSMPAWGDEFTTTDLEAVLQYILSLRQNQ